MEVVIKEEFVSDDEMDHNQCLKAFANQSDNDIMDDDLIKKETNENKLSLLGCLKKSVEHLKEPVYSQPVSCNNKKTKQKGPHSLGKSSETQLKLLDCIKETETASQVGKKKKTHQCSVCERYLTNSMGLKLHMRIHTGEKPFSCSECGKCFSRKYGLTQHTITHSGERKYSCSVCGSSFTQLSVLKTHEMSHTGELPYICSICGKRFRQSSHLTRHTRSHTGEAPYACTICHRSFKESFALKYHLRTHTGEKPHQCTVCDYRSTRPDDLKVHMYKHTGERPFVCDHPGCYKGFVKSSKLKNHKRAVHCEPSESHATATTKQVHLCPECGKSFGQATSLKQHLLIHSGDKPFSCDICGKCFSCSSNQKRHIQVHTGEKPYQCEICLLSFGRKYQLTSHISELHSEEQLLNITE